MSGEYSRGGTIVNGMTELSIDYRSHPEVEELVDRIRYCAESISIAFDDWDQPRVKGPGLYFAVVADRNYDDYADPMGDNRWPVESCRSVAADYEAFAEASEGVGFERDGGVVVAVDGVIEEQMVRFRDLEATAGDALADGVTYADWMGSRHMSALETSTRPAVVATVTLSEETGRVSLFRDGEVDSTERDEIGRKWTAD